MNLLLLDKSVNKIEEFKKRSRYRNPHLYEKDKVEGVDFVICPISNARIVKIKSNYIINVLGMEVEEYKQKFPEQQMTATGHKKKISNSLSKIDKKSGLTKYELSQKKARATLSKIGDDGLSGDKRRGKKLKHIHESKIDEDGLNGYQRLSKYRQETILLSGETIEQRAHKRRLNTILNSNIKNERKASQASIKMLTPILEWLDKNNIKYYFDNTEYGVNDEELGKYYFYDLVIPKFFICIEYQSNAYHPNPFIEDRYWNIWRPVRGKLFSADEKLKYDYRKAKVLYEKRNILTHFIWEEENSKVKELLCLLKTMNMKS